MRVLEIKGTIRKETGKNNTRKLRKEGNVPCVLYGGERNVHFTAPENSFKDLVYTHHVHLINLDLDGNKYKAIIRDIQFHPVTDRLQHMDFIQVFDDVSTVVDIPVELTGNSIGLKNGGKLRQKRRSLRVKGLIKDMPDMLEIDMTDVDIGQYIKISDLTYDNLEILTPARVMVVGVVSSRVAARSFIEAEEEAAAAAAAKAAAEEVKEVKEGKEAREDKEAREGKEDKEAKEEKTEQGAAHAEKAPAGDKHSEGGHKKEH
jgi:large subunit ribosomal protein L25